MTVSRRGTVCVFLAAVLYSIGGLCIKVIPWGGMAINGARTALALVVVGVYLKWTHHRVRVSAAIFIGALSVCGTNILFSVANKLTTAANTIVLQFTAPIFVLLFSVLFFRKHPSRLDIAACILVLGGVALFFLDSLSAGGMLGNVLAFLSGITYAGVFLMNALPGSDPISSVFWGQVIGAVAGLPFVVKEYDFTAPTMTALLILGVFQVGAAYILLTEGLKTTPPVAASLISGIEPVLNPILVAVFYHELIGPLSLAGAVIVVGGVVGYNMLKARQDQQQEEVSQHGA